MKLLLWIIAAALMLTGTGCVRMDGGSLLTFAEARQLGVENLLEVRCDEWHSELAEEFRSNQRFHALGREITFAGLESRSGRTGKDLELALGLMQELLLDADHDTLRRMQRARQMEILEEQLESAGMELLALESERVLWAEFPGESDAKLRQEELRLLWAEKNLLFRTMVGRDPGEALLLLSPEEEQLPPLPSPRADLTVALLCRPEFADCGVDAGALAAATEELAGMLPPESPDGSIAAMRTAQQLLLLPRRLTQRKLEGKSVPESARVLCSALGVMRQLEVGRREWQQKKTHWESLRAAEGSAPALQAARIRAALALHQAHLALRRDLGLLPGESLPEGKREKKEWQNVAGEIALTAEILMELMQELE